MQTTQNYLQSFNSKSTLYISYVAPHHTADDIRKMFPNIKVDISSTVTEAGLLSVKLIFKSHNEAVSAYYSLQDKGVQKVKGVYKFEYQDKIFKDIPYIYARNVSSELEFSLVKEIFEQRGKILFLEKVTPTEYRIFLEDISDT
jgi:hypothetical protein